MISVYKKIPRSLCWATLFGLMLLQCVTDKALAEQAAGGGAVTAAAETNDSDASIQELLATIQQLEARVEELEANHEKSVSTSAAEGSSASQAGSASAVPAGTAQQDPKSNHNGNNGFLAFFRSTELFGFVDGYYGYNFNQPTGDALLRNFDTKHNQFSLNLAEIGLEKKPTPEQRLGFRLDLDFGPATEMVHSLEPGGLGVYRNFQQGYLSYLAPVGKGLQIDVGKFVTQHGAEVIETKDNWNYSRSLLFALAIPYYHMGARIGYSPNDRASMGMFFSNGWNNVVDNNERKTFGFQIVLKPNAKWSIIHNYMLGPEQAKDNDDWRHLWDTTVTYSVSPKLSLMGNYDYGMDRSSGSRVHWQGFAGYARYQVNKVWALSPRFEWFDDPDGFTTGVRQGVKELTITSEQKINGGLLTRFEYRRDFSDQGFFQKSGDRLVKAQSTLTFGILYAFSSKGE
ncbi:MAG: porin [Acidobacteria bacterium]|nr:porin [Acidobacteriota bacterium]